jgi:tagaturonate reductase
LPENLVHAFAALIRFYKGDWQGSTILLNDSTEVLNFFNTVWREKDMGLLAQNVLSHQAFWDQDLTQVEGLAQRVKESLLLIEKANSVH